MIFSSLPFFLFFAVYFPLHLLIPRQYRIYLILIGSTFFYAYYRPGYVWIPMTLCAIAYAGAIWIEQDRDPAQRKMKLSCILPVMLAPLIFYKYTDFIITSVLGPFFGWSHKVINLPLPLGISFFTFTLISYVVDVYRGRFPVERQFHQLLGYVLYFPHQIAGPILKPAKLIPQLEHPKDARRARFTYGALLFALGLVKKLMFADSISPRVDAVYKVGANLPGFGDYLLAFYGFPMQIYCDFSGYTDMALGLAFLLGVRMPANFKTPYIATSLVDFWRRWHITFSFYLRDYLYIPLGGNRGGFAKQLRNIFITMLLGGLWHGANWTFVIWGGIHAVGIAACHTWRHFGLHRIFTAVPKALWLLLTFHWVAISWVFFRAPDFSTAYRVLKGVAIPSRIPFSAFVFQNLFFIILLAVFYGIHRWDDYRRSYVFTRRVPKPLAWAAISMLIVLTIALAGANSAAFIYFDF
jgi:alginate O-acetyltransferase complex protein AlgI